MSRRLCFALDLLDDAASIAEYERLHQPGGVWPAVIDDIRRQGIESMQIWRTGNRLLMVVEAAADYPRPRSDQVAAMVDQWEALVGQLQQRLPHAAGGEKWVLMHLIFDLAQHRGSEG